MTDTFTPETTATARVAARVKVQQMPGKIAPKGRRTPVVGKRDRALMWSELVTRIDGADTQDIPAERLLQWSEDAARAVVDARPHQSAKTKPAAQAGNQRAQERRLEWLRDSTVAGVAQLYRARQRASATSGTSGASGASATSGASGATDAPHHRDAAPLYDRDELRAIVAGQA